MPRMKIKPIKVIVRIQPQILPFFKKKYLDSVRKRRFCLNLRIQRCIFSNFQLFLINQKISLIFSVLNISLKNYLLLVSLSNFHLAGSEIIQHPLATITPKIYQQRHNKMFKIKIKPIKIILQIQPQILPFSL